MEEATVLLQTLVVLDADGFTVGTNDEVNASSGVYRYVAWDDNSETDLAIGSYTGDGNDDRSISGVGFQPDFVIVTGDATGQGVFRHKDDSGDVTHWFSAAADNTDRIQAFEADGFQVGGNIVETNQSGAPNKEYEYLAMKTDPGVFKQGTFTGNGTSQSIAVGFTPNVVIVKNDTTSTEKAVFTSSESGADNSHYFDTTADASGFITSLDANGFSVGSDDAVNKSTDTIMYMAWGETTFLPSAVLI